MARNFTNWLSAYASYTSDSESPAEYHFWSGVWTVAGALRRRVWIDMHKFQWTPNFYIVLVGPAGIVTKSTSARIGTRLLEKVDGVRFGPPSITWQKLADSLAEAMEFLEVIDPDSPTGKLHIPMSCLNIPVNELGTFLKMEESSFVDVLTALWDGQLENWSHSTKTSGTVEIKNPWINLLGCTTPSWLKEHFAEHQIGGGLASRIVFVYAEKKRHLVAYPDEVIPAADYRELERKLVADLQHIAKLSGRYELTKEARDWGHKWYAGHWDGNRPSHLASDRYGGYIARKQTHIHKLAIVLAASQRDKLLIEKVDLEMAAELLTAVEPHMIKVFESIGVAQESRRVQEIMPFLRAHGFLTPDLLWQKVMNLMSEREFNEAIKAAHRGGLIEVVTKGMLRGLAPLEKPVI